MSIVEFLAPTCKEEAKIGQPKRLLEGGALTTEDIQPTAAPMMINDHATFGNHPTLRAT